MICDKCKKKSVTFTYCVDKDCTHEYCGVLKSSCTHMFCTDCIHENVISVDNDDCFLCKLKSEKKNKSIEDLLHTRNNSIKKYHEWQNKQAQRMIRQEQGFYANCKYW